MADVGAVPHLLDALRNESEYVRRGAVEVLNEVVTTEAIKDLVDALRDADWWVRVRSADALGTLGGPRVVEAVLELVRDPDEFARRYAIEILNTVPDPRAVPALIEALDDEDWWVRERAVDALGKSGEVAAVEPILRMMGRDTRTLPLCVRALGAIGSPSVVDPLCRLVDSEDTDTRREALQALVELSRKELPEEARQSILAVLEKAGVRVARNVQRKPMDVRTGRGGDGPRPGDGARSGDGGRSGDSPSSLSPNPLSANPAPAPEPVREVTVRNFQKLAPGTELIGRFKVLQRVGGGGFGTVYLVEDVMVKEEMVLKILSSQLSLDPTMIRRFVQELKLTRRITHGNVIRIHDLLDLEGAHAISMEYFPGRDLGAVLREEGPMSPTRALHVAEQVLEGLAAAHSAGILHRDIKPANLLLGDSDLVKIVDFGLASVSHSTQSRLTQSGILVGTPEYISPEQITGTDIDARCDLYSLGVVLYEAMSGIQPFSGTSAVNILFQHLEADVPSLGSVAAGIPPKRQRRGHVRDVAACGGPAGECAGHAGDAARFLARRPPWHASTRSSRSASSRAVPTSTSRSGCRRWCGSTTSCCPSSTASCPSRSATTWCARSCATSCGASSRSAARSTWATPPKAWGGSASTSAGTAPACPRSAASSPIRCRRRPISGCRACCRSSRGSPTGWC